MASKVTRIEDMLVTLDMTVDGLKRGIRQSDQALSGFHRKTSQQVGGIQAQFANLNAAGATLQAGLGKIGNVLGPLGLGIGMVGSTMPITRAASRS